MKKITDHPLWFGLIVIIIMPASGYVFASNQWLGLALIALQVPWVITKAYYNNPLNSEREKAEPVRKAQNKSTR